jgi:hypothetical protein
MREWSDAAIVIYRGPRVDDCAIGNLSLRVHHGARHNRHSAPQAGRWRHNGAQAHRIGELQARGPGASGSPAARTIVADRHKCMRHSLMNQPRKFSITAQYRDAAHKRSGNGVAQAPDDFPLGVFAQKLNSHLRVSTRSEYHDSQGHRNSKPPAQKQV